MQFEHQHSTGVSLKSRQVLAIVGPTASGKTPLSLLVAEFLNGEIVSADSRQIYRCLDIGTAKPTQPDRQRVPHHFIDILDPAVAYSAGQYGLEAREVIGQILDRGKIPILVGGSGLYLKAAIDGLFNGPGRDAETRARLEDQLHSEGIDALLNDLREIDPRHLEKLKEVTPRRVIRALEVYYITGTPITQLQTQQDDRPDFETEQFGLEWDRKELYGRIDERVDRMISDGLIEEVRSLKARGFSRLLNALNTVGYKEVFDYLEGLSDRGAMVGLIKRNTRRFAKRQMTWFKADPRIHWIHMSGDTELSIVARNIVMRFRKQGSSR